MENESIRRKEWGSIWKSLAVAGIYILWGFCYYKLAYQMGFLISLDDADGKQVLLLFQHMVANFPVFLYIAACHVKKPHDENLFLNLPKGTPGRGILMLCMIVYLALAACAVKAAGNAVSALYLAVFYLFFVSFVEEFLYRGLLPAMLERNKAVIRWLLPNVIFSASHFVMLFVYDDGLHSLLGWSSLGYFIHTVVFGLAMELVKRKGRSLYIPVLVHGIYDFYYEMMLYF